jgi:hypothetical protein
MEVSMESIMVVERYDDLTGTFGLKNMSSVGNLIG